MKENKCKIEIDANGELDMVNALLIYHEAAIRVAISLYQMSSASDARGVMLHAMLRALNILGELNIAKNLSDGTKSEIQAVWDDSIERGEEESRKVIMGMHAKLIESGVLERREHTLH